MPGAEGEMGWLKTGYPPVSSNVAMGNPLAMEILYSGEIIDVFYL